MESEQNSYEGWSVVDVMGKQRYIGHVRTETYGTACMFRVDVPDLPERESVLQASEWVGETLARQGTRVLREAVPGYTKLIGAGSIYMLSPCSEEAARAAIEKLHRSPMRIVGLAPEVKGQIEQAADDDDDSEPYDEEDDDNAPPF